jgi:hypothetical protein
MNDATHVYTRLTHLRRPCPRHASARPDLAAPPAAAAAHLEAIALRARVAANLQGCQHSARHVRAALLLLLLLLWCQRFHECLQVLQAAG